MSTTHPIPLGHIACEQCPGYGELYQLLPICRDCGERVCVACHVPGSVRDGDEHGDTCLCKLCESWAASMVRARNDELLQATLADERSAARMQEACDEQD